MGHNEKPSQDELIQQRVNRAANIANAGSISAAIEKGLLPKRVGLTLSEALVLGLLRQGVKVFFAVFGHGSTDVGEVLRIYQDVQLLKVFGVRNEIEASHAAAALRWVRREKSAVVTSIGPGAFQALAASLVPASDNLGVWYLFGDETSEDEGFNMQHIPKHEQGLFLQITATMGRSYTLHTPAALPTALRRGAATVDNPSRSGPFYLLLPMNTQPAWIPDFNSKSLLFRFSSDGRVVGEVIDPAHETGCVCNATHTRKMKRPPGYQPGRNAVRTSSFTARYRRKGQQPHHQRLMLIQTLTVSSWV